MADNRLLTTRQAAEYLGVSERHIFANPRIPRVRLPGMGSRTMLRFRVADLDEYVSAHRVEPVVRTKRSA